jgi:long-chain fatty acid transport protein
MLKRCALLLLAIPNLLMAMNGMACIGEGIKSSGMGGVVVAYPQDSLAGIGNPAGLAYIGTRWDIGLSCRYHHSSHLLVFGDQLGISWEFCPGQTIGLSAIPYGGLYSCWCKDRFWYIPYQVVPCWSWKINRFHSVGLSIPIAITYLEQRGGLSSSASVFPDDQTNRGPDIEAGMAIQVGWLGAFTRSLVMGATFRTQTWMSRFEKYQGLLAGQGSADLPPMAGLGVTWHFCPCCTASAEIDHYFWQRVRWLGSVLVQGGRPGSTAGPGFGWSDQTVAKVGVAWRPLLCLKLRFGYNYGRQPIAPTETLLNTLTLATIEHHLTAGLSWQIRRFELSAFYSYGFQNQVIGDAPFSNPALAFDIFDRQQAFGISVGRLF